MRRGILPLPFMMLTLNMALMWHMTRSSSQTPRESRDCAAGCRRLHARSTGIIKSSLPLLQSRRRRVYRGCSLAAAPGVHRNRVVLPRPTRPLLMQPAQSETLRRPCRVVEILQARVQGPQERPKGGKEKNE
jgi:hypothetical protein